MKVSLVHGKYFNSWEALGLGYIGAYLKAHEPGIEIQSFQGCFDTDDEVLRGCSDSDIVAFSCTTPTFPHTVQIARSLKAIRPAIHTVVGGYHASSTGAQSLVPGIDQVVVGEGEAAMLDIVRGRRDPVIQARLMSFDEVPWPDRELINNERNIQVAYRDNHLRITSFQSHRGCPFACKYCADGHVKALYAHHPRGSIVRHREAGDLLDEIAEVALRYRLNMFKFSDPTWNINPQWVIDFCEEKIRRGLTTPFYPNIHAGAVSEEMFAAMAAANCHQIAVGVESGSPRILKQIGKGTTLDTIRRGVTWARKAGLRIRGYFILGMPDEDETDVQMTRQFAEELRLDEYGFSILCPYPGTEMYDAARFSNVDWATADEYSNDFWCTRHLSNTRLKEWQAVLKNRFSSKLTWHNRVVTETAVPKP